MGEIEKFEKESKLGQRIGKACTVERTPSLVYQMQFLHGVRDDLTHSKNLYKWKQMLTGKSRSVAWRASQKPTEQLSSNLADQVTKNWTTHRVEQFRDQEWMKRLVTSRLQEGRGKEALVAQIVAMIEGIKRESDLSERELKELRDKMIDRMLGDMPEQVKEEVRKAVEQELAD